MDRLIAHSENNLGEKQLLATHLFNVGNKISEALKPIDLSSLGFFVGFMHDIGKGQQEWQDNITNKSKTIPHAVFARIIYNKDIFPNNSNIEIDSEYRYLIMQSILSHHSTIHNDVDYLNLDSFLESEQIKKCCVSKEQDTQVLMTVLNDTNMPLTKLVSYFDNGYKEFSVIYESIKHRRANSNDDIDKVNNAIRCELNFLLNLILSALMDADWSDTQEHQIGIKTYKTSLPDWSRLSEALESNMKELPSRNSLDELRKHISNECYAAALNNEELDYDIQRLSVFCGGGKTLSSARYALKHAERFNKSRLFYIIPFTSIIEQNAAVISDMCDTRQNDLLEHHCNAGSLYDNKNDQYESSDKTPTRSVQRYNESIVMTTQVRFFDTVFSQNKKDRRLFSQYINSEIIFDEFQALPIKCMDLFYILIEFMCRVMKCNILLCSATQAQQAAYRTSWSPKLLTNKDWDKYYEDEAKRSIVYNRTSTSPTHCINKTGQIIDLICDKHNSDKSVLVITNTKKQARELFINMRQTGFDNLYHLSTNMVPEHRKNVLSEVDKSLKNHMPTILISTSLVEAGVDISFDVVVRYLNGIDSIIQSAGRCNRNQLNNNAGEVYIVDDPEQKMFKTEKDISRKLLRKFPDKITCSIHDLLTDYYKYRIEKITLKHPKYKMLSSYPIEIEGHATNLIECWGHNNEYRNSPLYKMKGRKFYGQQAPDRCSMVKTAQQEFRVIESAGQDVTVILDNNAKQAAKQYETVDNYSDFKKVQKTLSKYSLSLNSFDFSKIEFTEVVNHTFHTILYVVDDIFYNDDYGIDPKADMDFVL